MSLHDINRNRDQTFWGDSDKMKEVRETDIDGLKVFMTTCMDCPFCRILDRKLGDDDAADAICSHPRTDDRYRMIGQYDMYKEIEIERYAPDGEMYLMTDHVPCEFPMQCPLEVRGE